jgi:CRISPR-associated protein Csm4
VAAADSAEDRDDLARKWKEVAWLSPEDFDAFRGGRLPDLPADKRAAPSLTVSRLHASLDRRSNRTIEPGGLREEEEVYLGEGADHLTVYARVATDWAGRLDCLWQSLALSGFGKKKSSGMGAFDYGGLERFDGFSSPPCADGFVALSHFVPARADPADGDYSLTVKYGKLGDAWAVGTENPFKRPLAMIQPGSCFRTAGPPRPWYGRAVQGLAPGRPEAAQLAFALAAPMRWPPPAPAGRKERSDG